MKKYKFGWRYFKNRKNVLINFNLILVGIKKYGITKS